MHLPRKLKAAGAAVLFATAFLLSTDELLGEIRYSLFRSLGYHSHSSKLALVRPIPPGGGQALLESFDLWDPHWPCSSKGLDYQVDLFISFSRTLDRSEHPGDVEALEKLKSKFEAHGGWNNCVSRLHVIEIDIAPEMDIYEKADEQKNPMWVNGPNEQFRKTLREIMTMTRSDQQGREVAEYEIVYNMEADARPNKWGWLDSIQKEIKEEAPFAILGSKYKGHSWDSYKDDLPLALKEHINGNAAYNLTHPLMQAILDELDAEAGTYFNAIPFDYRISQMITEGSTGTDSPFPFPSMSDENGGPIVLPDKMQMFQGWWEKWGSEDPYKKSMVIANLAATNFLPHDLGDEPIVHGNKPYQPWNPRTHDITLVVNDWIDNISDGLISELDKTTHPFTEVVVMRSKEHKADKKPNILQRLSQSLPVFAKGVIPVTYIERESFDFMDLCDAEVNTKWFMMTNAYHHVKPEVDLLFTHEDIPRPVIPYTPADTSYCTDFDACRETIRLARKIQPDMDRVVLDMDMLYHTPSRNAFCEDWKMENGVDGEILGNIEAMEETGVESTPHGPTATVYLAYLYKTRLADTLYKFTNKIHYGTKSAFIKIHDVKEMKQHEKLRVERKVSENLVDKMQSEKYKKGKYFGYGKNRKESLQLSEPGQLIGN